MRREDKLSRMLHGLVFFGMKDCFFPITTTWKKILQKTERTRIPVQCVSTDIMSFKHLSTLYVRFHGRKGQFLI